MRNIRKISVFVLIIAIILVFSACGSEKYSFTVIDGESEHTAEMSKGDKIEGSAAVYLNDGGVLYAEDYKVNENILGVIKNAPEKSVRDVYNISKECIDNNEKVMVVYLDGFGWQSYEKALERGDLKNLSKLEASKALSMYPTITPVNYAAMVTGETPKVNGVSARGIHQLSCDSIFDYVVSSGKTAYIAEGDAQIIRFSVPQELNVDLDGDGDTDNEILECALEAIESDAYDYLFVHFHGIDDTSHANGPDAQATIDKISETDEMFGMLAEKWTGKIIVIADHGQHENDGNGDDEYADKTGIHGAFASSDIVVPLLTN